MSTTDLKALERHFVEEWNKGKTAAMVAVDKMGATNSVFHTSTGNDIQGLDGIKQMFSEYYDTFPDSHMTLEDMIVEGDKLALRYTITGTHKDTHKKVTTSSIEICHIVGGKFVECWQAHVSP
jgi:predicted ester cyclase